VIDAKLLELIQCPIDGQSLELANEDLIVKLNAAIKEGRVRDRSDQAVGEPMEEGLVTADGKRVYPSRGGIPTLVADNAIETKVVSDQP